MQITDRINIDLKKETEANIERLVKKLEKEFHPKGEIKSCKMLDWEEIKEMNKWGIDFGSHAKTHRNLCLLNDDELRSELVDSKKEIEDKTGVEINAFTYPFGILDDRVKDFVVKAGYKYARTSSKGVNRKDSDRFLLSSIGMGSLSKTSFLANRISVNLLHEILKFHTMRSGTSR